MLSDRELQTLRNQGNEAEAAADEITGLRRQVAAARVLIEGADARAIHQAREFAELQQRASGVSSERAANAILTEENERLRAQAQADAMQLVTTGGQAEEHWAEVQRLRSALGASCIEERSQIWEAGPGGGCERAIDAEAEVKRLRGERTVLLGLIGQAISVIETIEPDDSDDFAGLQDILHKLTSAALCDSHGAEDLFSDHQSTRVERC